MLGIAKYMCHCEMNDNKLQQNKNNIYHKHLNIVPNLGIILAK
jgi:hypothetical protein